MARMISGRSAKRAYSGGLSAARATNWRTISAHGASAIKAINLAAGSLEEWARFLTRRIAPAATMPAAARTGEPPRKIKAMALMRAWGRPWIEYMEAELERLEVRRERLVKRLMGT